jgi:hypothetical protein
MRGFAVGVSSMLWLLLLVSETLLLPQLAGGAPSLPDSDGRPGSGLAGWSGRSLLQEGAINGSVADGDNATSGNSTNSTSNSSSPADSSNQNIAPPPEPMPSLSDDFMGMWQGIGEEFSYCGVGLGSTLTMVKDARGNIIANLSMVSRSAHYSDVALDAVAEIVMMNITEELVARGKTASGGEVAAYSIELQLLDVLHWHHGCDGASLRHLISIFAPSSPVPSSFSFLNNLFLLPALLLLNLFLLSSSLPPLPSIDFPRSPCLPLHPPSTC